jgi:hypothetical protein
MPYRFIPVNIGKGEQFAPEFVQHSINNKITYAILLAYRGCSRQWAGGWSIMHSLQENFTWLT